MVDNLVDVDPFEPSRRGACQGVPYCGRDTLDPVGFAETGDVDPGDAEPVGQEADDVQDWIGWVAWLRQG